MKNKNLGREFTYQDLPRSRRSQFSDIFKNEWRTLLLIGLWLLISAIPYLVVFVGRFLGYSFLLGAYQEAGISQEEINLRLVIFNLIVDAVNIFSFIVLAIPLAGSSRVFRNLVYGEGILFKDDFIKGVKDNVLMYIVLCFIFGAIKSGVNYLINFSNMNGNMFYLIMSGFLLIAFYLLIVPALALFANLKQTYQITFMNAVKTSIKMSIVSFIVVLLFAFPLYFAQYISFIAVLFVGVLLICIIFLILGPLYLLLWKLYIAHLFDKYINSTSYPDFYRKGLAKE